MAIKTQRPSVIIAGATGLVGKAVLQRLLSEPAIEHIYSLSRRHVMAASHSKLTELIDPQLRITDWSHNAPAVRYGIIALGTTRKQAGSAAGLEKIDFELVCQVAHSMKLLGVTHIAIVSSYGANPTARSHYLRCKGRMEETIRRLDFEQIIFVRPGPLAGQREQSRKDELWLQRVMKFAQWLLFGQLKNLIPIHADKVAQALLYALFELQNQRVRTLSSTDMLKLIDQYR